jgi:hypothetical protein
MVQVQQHSSRSNGVNLTPSTDIQLLSYLSACFGVLKKVTQGPGVQEVTDGSRGGTSGTCVLHVCDPASRLFSAARIATPQHRR